MFGADINPVTTLTTRITPHAGKDTTDEHERRAVLWYAGLLGENGRGIELSCGSLRECVHKIMRWCVGAV